MLLLAGVAILAALAFAGPGPFGFLADDPSAEAGSGGPEMGLAVTSGAASCDAMSCDVPLSGKFTLAVRAITRPAAGYISFQSYLDFGEFLPTASEDGAGPNTCSDGIDNGGGGEDRRDADCVTVYLQYSPLPATSEIVWPDLVQAAALALTDGPGLRMHGGVTGVIPPLPVSTFEGNVVRIFLTCPASEVSTAVKLLPRGDSVAAQNGALFIQPDLQQVVPKVSLLTINCLDIEIPTATNTPTRTPTNTPPPGPTSTPTKLPEPGDTDGDGCSDQRENGPNPQLGGQRDYRSAWDFYDVVGSGGGPRDKVVDLPNDILGVIQHFSPQGLPPYHLTYDRGPNVGEHPWSLSHPDFVIDLPNDILGVIQQFFHSCD